MAKRPITDRMLKGLKPAADGKRYEIWDTIRRGFGVRVSANGEITFILMKRFPGSRNAVRRSLGRFGEVTLAEARDRAQKWMEDLQKGIDPASRHEVQPLQDASFATVAEDFIKMRLQGQRKGHEVAKDIQREFIPLWGRQNIRDIARSDVAAAITAVVARGHAAQARNLLGNVRRLFNWAIATSSYGIETSPCDRIRPNDLIGRKAIRKRVLSDSELIALWATAAAMPYPYGPLFQLLALTVQRRNEVAGARWSEIDLTNRLWVIPAERMKSDVPHAVPLTEPAVNLLRALPRFEGGDCVFSTTHGKKPVNGFSKAKLKLDAGMGHALNAPFVIHDIRRTGRTRMSGLPIPAEVAELVIAHARPGLRRVYDLHAFESEKRRALELWAARLLSIVEPKPANVVPISSAVA